MNDEPKPQPIDKESDDFIGDLAIALEIALATRGINPRMIQELWIEHAEYFEDLADNQEDSHERAMVDIDAILSKADIFRSASMPLRYIEELDMADMYASNIGLRELSDELSKEISMTAQSLKYCPERTIVLLRGHISDDNRAFLWDIWADEQDHEDFVNHVHGMLEYEGNDADAILANLGVFEQ